MHEYSIVQSLLDSCEIYAHQNRATKVTKVVIKIGVLSGVEPELLQTAFLTFKESTLCHEAELVINMQPVVIECLDCKTDSTLDKYNYICPKCKSNNIKIIDGEEMFLMSLELES